jgi:hypothetical protein
VSQDVSAKEKYIFKSAIADFFILHFPIYSILIYYAIFRGLQSGSTWHQRVVAFIALIIADNGHVYTTIWRTYFNPREFRNNRFYIWFPILCFAGIMFATQIAHQLFWSFVIYFTIYHNLRQLYGFYRWYGAINKFKDKLMNFFFYAICLCPVLIAHTGKPKYLITYYTPNDVIFFENIYLYRFFWTAYLFLMLWFIGYVGFLRLKQRGMPNSQFFFMLASFVLYNQAFLEGTTSVEIIGPLSLSHGVAYFASMALCLQQANVKSDKLTKFASLLFSKGMALTVFYIVLTAVLFGYGDQIFSEEIVDLDEKKLGWIESFFIAVWITPLFAHYYFDSKIWRHFNPDFKELLDSYKIA